LWRGVVVFDDATREFWVEYEERIFAARHQLNPTRMSGLMCCWVTLPPRSHERFVEFAKKSLLEVVEVPSSPTIPTLTKNRTGKASQALENSKAE
jgi:hypothetical protein